jgi:hypothetical protein
MGGRAKFQKDVTRGSDFSLRSRRRRKAPREAAGVRGVGVKNINRAIGDGDGGLMIGLSPARAGRNVLPATVPRAGARGFTLPPSPTA